jgi:Kinesin-like protein
MAPEVKNVQEAFNIIQKGTSNRTIGSTYMNEVSSRSHLIVMFTVLSTNKITGKNYTSRLNLIDLAGSERLYKSESEGERMKEACHINQR